MHATVLIPYLLKLYSRKSANKTIDRYSSLPWLLKSFSVVDVASADKTDAFATQKIIYAPSNPARFPPLQKRSALVHCYKHFTQNKEMVIVNKTTHVKVLPPCRTTFLIFQVVSFYTGFSARSVRPLRRCRAHLH